MTRFRKHMQGMFLLMAGLLLAACATGATTQTTEENTIASDMSALVIAQKAAMDYIALPACGSSGASSVCSTPVMVGNIKKASQDATTVLINAQKAAQANQPVDMVAVDGALTMLQDLVNQVKPAN